MYEKFDLILFPIWVCSESMVNVRLCTVNSSNENWSPYVGEDYWNSSYEEWYLVKQGLVVVSYTIKVKFCTNRAQLLDFRIYFLFFGHLKHPFILINWVLIHFLKKKKKISSMKLE